MDLGLMEKKNFLSVPWCSGRCVVYVSLFSLEFECAPKFLRRVVLCHYRTLPLLLWSYTQFWHRSGVKSLQNFLLLKKDLIKVGEFWGLSWILTYISPISCPVTKCSVPLTIHSPLPFFFFFLCVICQAELRASVFEAIEEEDHVIEKDEGLPPALLGSCNDRAKQLHASPSGSIAHNFFCLLSITS